MSNQVQVKEKITQEIQKAKQEGKLRTENIKEIVRGAIINAMAELKEGASEIRAIVKEAIATVVENLQEKDTSAHCAYWNISRILIHMIRLKDLNFKQLQLYN